MRIIGIIFFLIIMIYAAHNSGFTRGVKQTHARDLYYYEGKVYTRAEMLEAASYDIGDTIHLQEEDFIIHNIALSDEFGGHAYADRGYRWVNDTWIKRNKKEPVIRIKTSFND